MGIATLLRKIVLLLALLPAAVPAVATRFNDAPTAPTRAEQFDDIFQRVVGPSSIDTPFEIYDKYLDQLRVLLPANDPVRDIRFRSVYCGSQHWKDAKQGLAYTDEALRRANAASDVASQGRALFCRVNFISMLRGSKQSLIDADKMVTLLQSSSERQLYSEALLLRGGLLSDLGEQAKALMDFQRARAGFREAGIDHEIDYLLMKTAVTYRRIGDFSQAERYFTQSVARLQDKQDWERMKSDLIQLGYLYDESGALPQSRATFERALAVATGHKDALGIAAAQMGLASTLISQGEFDPALVALTEARTGFAAEQITSNEAMLQLLTGQAMAGNGQHEVALSHYKIALPLIEKDGNQRYLALLYKARSASNEALNHSNEALIDYKHYSDLQTILQSKMRLEQSRLLEYEYEIRRRDFENHRLRNEANVRQQQLAALQRERRWQILAIALGGVLFVLLASLAWRQLLRSRQLRTLAMTDPLTGAASRLAIENTANRSLAMARQHGTPLSILLLDLDFFKSVNDRYGHAAGDTVLRATVQAWQAQLRGRDALGRIGGEEFAVVCIGANHEQAQVIASRLLDATRALRFPEIDPALRITTSIGIAEVMPDENREALFARADTALYRAKQQGRDRAE